MTGDFLLSIFTMALLEDSGWYRMGDFVPDTVTYGYKRGCDYLYNGCKNKLYPEYCNSKLDKVFDYLISVPSLKQV